MGQFYKGGDGAPRNTWRNNISIAMKRNAVISMCPKCKRKGAIKADKNPALGTVLFCRWSDCDYEKVLELIS